MTLNTLIAHDKAGRGTAYTLGDFEAWLGDRANHHGEHIALMDMGADCGCDFDYYTEDRGSLLSSFASDLDLVLMPGAAEPCMYCGSTDHWMPDWQF